MGLIRRVIDPAVELRSLQDLSHRVWKHDPGLLNFETSFGTLAWERGGFGRTRAFERNGSVVGWARLVPGYSRIRSSEVRDDAPPSLVWQVDLADPDRLEVLGAILDWGEERAERLFTTSHNEVDAMGSGLLEERGYTPDQNKPFSMYLQQPLDSTPEPVLAGYRFTTMEELDDVDRRAEVHRLAWDGSSLTGDDFRSTMATWPYKASLDLVALVDDGSMAGSAIAWFDSAYEYGEFEPVGTVPERRGSGVGAGLLRFGLAQLRNAGAAFAVVGARADDDYPVPRRLYRSVGFREISRQVIVRSPAT